MDWHWWWPAARTAAQSRHRGPSDLTPCPQAKEPQAIYNRDRLVAAVVDPGTFAEFEAWRAGQQRGSIAEAFAELRALCAEEGYRLRLPRREDRGTPFDAGDVPWAEDRDR